MLILLVWPAFGLEPNTENTFKLGSSAPPSATIEDAAVLIGNWHGEAFGSRFEETWNAPSAGTMVGMFKVFDEAKGVSFYELMLIVEEAGSLVLKVKHFGADFSAWESKEGFVRFALASKADGALIFEGLSFYPKDENTIEAFLAMKSKDGLREEKLIYRRVDSGNK